MKKKITKKGSKQPNLQNSSKDQNVTKVGEFEKWVKSEGSFFDKDDYYREMPITEERLKRIALEMIEFFVSDVQTLKFKDYLQISGISIGVWYNWKLRHPTIERAHEYAMMILGNRREHRGLRGELNWGGIERSMANYDNDWRELEEWRASLKNITDEKKGDVHVYIDNIPLSEKK